MWRRSSKSPHCSSTDPHRASDRAAHERAAGPPAAVVVPAPRGTLALGPPRECRVIAVTLPGHAPRAAPQFGEGVVIEGAELDERRGRGGDVAVGHEVTRAARPDQLGRAV